MDIRQQVLDKYKEFNEYLTSIDLVDLRSAFTRQELDSFKSSLQDSKLRSLAYEIGNMTKEMKEEEFPQLLGVHHFPIINKIDFLTDNQKIELDKFLVLHRIGNTVSGLWRITKNEKMKKDLETWLHEAGVLEETHVVLCPGCRESFISKTMTADERTSLQALFNEYKQTGEYEQWEELSKMIQPDCFECDDVDEIDEMNELAFLSYYSMKKERDKSLDKA